MRYLIIFLFSFSLQAQVTLKQIEIYKPAGVRTPGYFGLTNANGVQVYTNLDSIVNGGMIDCDYIISCLDSSEFFCDEVLECLDAGALCEAMNNFGNQNVASTGKFVWINQAGECKRGDISSLPGFGFNCDSVQNCLESGILCEVLNDFDSANITVGAKIIFIDDEGNCFRGDLGDIPGTFNCDSVLICLNDGLLCEAIGMFPMGVPADGDYVAVWNEDGCKLVSLDSLGGGMDSLNCEAVLECVTDSFICDIVETCLGNGLLCDELQDFPVDDALTGFNLIGVMGGECFQFNWDSITAECAFEVEVGAFAQGNPDGCSWATTCDGGITQSNTFWSTLVLNGQSLELYGDAEGQAACLMSSVDFEPLLQGVDSIWPSGTGCAMSINWSKGGNNYSFALPTYSLDAIASAGNVKILFSATNNAGTTLCDSVSFCVCDQSAGCSGVVNGTCGVPLMSDQEGEVFHTGSSPNISKFNAMSLPVYKRHKDAKKDCELLTGDLYTLKRSNKIYFKNE